MEVDLHEAFILTVKGFLAGHAVLSDQVGLLFSHLAVFIANLLFLELLNFLPLSAFAFSNALKRSLSISSSLLLVELLPTSLLREGVPLLFSI